MSMVILRVWFEKELLEEPAVTKKAARHLQSIESPLLDNADTLKILALLGYTEIIKHPGRVGVVFEARLSEEYVSGK